MKKLLACLLVVATSGCPEVRVDPDETGGGPVVEFDPARTQAVGARFIPFPNDLARDPATGRVNLPVQACESVAAKLTREQLNKLDGFGTYETAMQVTFTQPVDPASLENHIVMFQLTKQGTPVTPTMSTQPVPIRVVRVATTPRFSTGDCSVEPEQVNAVTFVPLVPLEQKSTYFVALLKGIKDANGVDFASTFTWELVKSTENPVTVENGIVISDRTPLDPSSAEGLASLLALDGMWKLHAPGIAFVEAVTGTPRADIIVGFQFTTQTTIDPLDRSIADSPAGTLSTAGVVQANTLANRFGPASALCGAEAGTAQCFLKLALGGCSPLTTGCGPANYTAGASACALVGCAAIGDVIGGGVLNVNYQTQLENTKLPGGAKLQGPWTDPYHPENQVVIQVLETIIVIPASAPPATGYPVIMFAHGLTSSKESVLAIAGRFAAAGFATVAIDAVGHGGRAVRTSKAAALGCIGRCFSGTTATATECDTNAECGANETCGLAADPTTMTPAMFVPPSPTTASQCYAPFLSSDLAATRDSIRETVLDQQRVALALNTCGTTGCQNVPKLDPSKMYFVGFSIGGFIGTVTGAMLPGVNVVALNAGGVGWADFLENTQTLAIQCQLVDGLIDAGILVGEKWNGGSQGLCTTDAWKAQPGYATFAATGRWMLDPADGANFSTRLAPKRLLIQQIVGDTVIPNLTTNNLAALVGMAANVKPGDPFDGQPSAAITAMPKMNKFLSYTTDASNIFAHPSLLRPATETQAGIFGTQRLQVDLTTFLSNQ